MHYQLSIAEHQINCDHWLSAVFAACIPDGINNMDGTTGVIALMKLRFIRSCIEDQHEALLINNGPVSVESAHRVINGMILITIKCPNDEWSVTS